MKTIEHLIINNPYEKPTSHWSYDRQTQEFNRAEGRRSAGYVVASSSSKTFDDPGVFVELPLVNQVRKRVDYWREQGYPGVTGVTKRLLEYWQDPEESRYRKFFFCQLEAIETLIWLVEAADSDKQGIHVPSDGGQFQRLCSKMATGSGKTIVMAMLVAWQILNKVTYPRDLRFSKNVLVVAPGLTVKSRLRVLDPMYENNYYSEFNIIPSVFYDKLRQGKVVIVNWHTLSSLDENSGPKVVKKGPESDEAFVRRVLADFAGARGLIVINDEAHHAWRVPAESKVKGVKKEDIDQATMWIGALDRIHSSRGIQRCFDFSATPFAPSGKTSSEEALFGWIVSDFGLNDAIESGLVKTPRVVIRDDGQLSKDYKSRFYHLYMDDSVKVDLNRKASPEEPLPDLVTTAYYFLGKDWVETLTHWRQANSPTPPVMITVCNRTETSARIEYAFNHRRVLIDELSDPHKTLRIDSSVLGSAEIQEVITNTDEDAVVVGEEGGARSKTKKELAEELRQKVDTVGQPGQPGAALQNIIAVAMLSEGWDAKTVTHIMGLRAFSSQLLCEQVIGRGLRRTSYEINEQTGCFEPEYVNIFGVPFSFLPHEGGEGTPPAPPTPKTRIESTPARQTYEISWPNIVRVEHVFKPKLSLDMNKIRPLKLDPSNTPLRAEMAPVVEGKPYYHQLTTIELEQLGRRFRQQKIIFEVARDIFDQMKPSWVGNKDVLLLQVIRLVESFITSKALVIPSPWCDDELRRRVLITLNMSRIVQHVFEEIVQENTETPEPVFDKERPIRTTSDMMTWYTSKPCHPTQHSHVNHVVFDSTWEASEAFQLEYNDNVDAWVKNDHLGFEILYIYQGVVRKYRPDFLVSLKNGVTLVLEVKGQDDQQNRSKRQALQEWVTAVNSYGGFGTWAWDVSFAISDLPGIINVHSGQS